MTPALPETVPEEPSAPPEALERQRRLLAPSSSPGSVGAGAAGGPAASGRAERPRRRRVLRLPAAVTARLRAGGAAGGGDAPRGPAGRPRRAALAPYSGAEDLLIGTPVADRDAAGGRGADRALRQPAAAARPVEGTRHSAACWRRCARAARAALAHADLPFEALVEELRPERDPARRRPGDPRPGRAPARRRPAPPGEGPSCAPRLPSGERRSLARPRCSRSRRSRTRPGSRQLDLALDLRRRPLHRGGRGRLLAHYATLLAGAAAAPELPLSRLPLLARGRAPPDRGRVERHGGRLPATATVHGLFEEQAAARPDAVAVAWERGR